MAPKVGTAMFPTTARRIRTNPAVPLSTPTPASPTPAPATAFPQITKATKSCVDKAPKYYPADDIAVKVPTDRELNSRGVAKLRKSITPGTVLILLAGRFRGRRVVFLRQLSSGLLLVTGPYQVNGIPLRRVNQAYVITTSTKVDVTKVDSKKVRRRRTVNVFLAIKPLRGPMLAASGWERAQRGPSLAAVRLCA